MERPPSPPEPEPRITRSDLAVVIRRAAELYSREADADEQLSEAEVLRIAEELGLPDRHVRQALYELPARPLPTTRLDRWFGVPAAQASRVVPGEPGTVMDRLEAYLATREYLRLVRRQAHRASFTPADDAISSMARAVRRPAGQWQIARSQVLVDVRPMAGDESHVRVHLDMASRRRRAVAGGLAGGIALGVPVAAALAIPTGGLVFDLAGGAAAATAAVSAGLAGLGGTVTAALAIARARFRNRLDNARTEMAALLDRLEAGGRLDPPPAPWLRGLKEHVNRTLRGGGT
jgi:hypothetical protein